MRKYNKYQLFLAFVQWQIRTYVSANRLTHWINEHYAFHLIVYSVLYKPLFLGSTCLSTTNPIETFFKVPLSLIIIDYWVSSMMSIIPVSVEFMVIHLCRLTHCQHSIAWGNAGFKCENKRLPCGWPISKLMRCHLSIWEHLFPINAHLKNVFCQINTNYNIVIHHKSLHFIWLKHS